MFQDMLKFLERSLLTLFVIFFIGGVFNFLVAEISEVNGRSMEPTLRDGELIVIDKLTLLTTKPKRGQIVSAFGEYENLLVVKRIIGLPGETVILRDGRVLIEDTNGDEHELIELYLGSDIETLPLRGCNFDYEIPEGEYFLMGDNRAHSTDSRSYGTIPRNDIVGIVRAIPIID
ncbi:MAG: signal peptidase I [bacterium]